MIERDIFARYPLDRDMREDHGRDHHLFKYRFDLYKYRIYVSIGIIYVSIDPVYASIDLVYTVTIQVFASIDSRYRFLYL